MIHVVVSSYSKSETSYTKQVLLAMILLCSNRQVQIIVHYLHVQSTASWSSDSTDCELVAGDPVQPITPTTTTADSTTYTADSTTVDSDQELFV